MFTWLVLIGVGAFFVWLAVHGLVRRTYMEGVPFIHAAILKASGEDPRPKQAWERAQDHVHLWLTLLLGVAATGLGLLGIVSA